MLTVLIKSAVQRGGMYLLQPVSGLCGLFQPYRDATVQVAGTNCVVDTCVVCFLSGEDDHPV